MLGMINKPQTNGDDMKIAEVEEVVQLLNEDFIDRLDVESFDFVPFELKATGHHILVCYCGYSVWSDDCDERIYDDDKDEYEPLRDFVLRESRKIYSLIERSLPPAGSA